MSNPLQITRTSADGVSWTAITAPCDANSVDLHNSETGVGFSVRSASADANTQDTIQGGGEYVVVAQREAQESGRARFLRGTTVLYVQVPSGTGPIVARWLR